EESAVVLHLEPGAQLHDLGIGGREKEIPRRLVACVAAGFVVKAMQLLAREEREPHIDFGGELGAEAASGHAGAACSERRRALEDEDGEPALGRMPSDAAAHRPGADDDCVVGLHVVGGWSEGGRAAEPTGASAPAGLAPISDRALIKPRVFT